jgi:hypothetical protein
VDITQTLLKNLSGGELQKLAEDLLTRINNWKHISQYGGCEGGFRTRKGIPDIWAENEIEEITYICATGDSAKGKMLADIISGVNKLVQLGINNTATVISFLNYDPDSEEVIKCRAYCQAKSCKFEYYPVTI